MTSLAHHLITAIVTTSLLCFVAGCAPSAPPAAPVAETKPANASPAVTAPTGNELNEAIQQPIDRAKAVEGDVMKAKSDLDAKMDEQGG